MASPAASAAAMTLSSFNDPPGWITAIAPASAAASSPSGNGKNASEATTEPLVGNSASPSTCAISPALRAAIRVDSTRIAARKAGDMAQVLGLAELPTKGSVVASDAFFPFPDGLLAAAEAGAMAVIQPGGSLNDDKVIAAADAAGLAMVFTGQRHFRH